MAHGEEQEDARGLSNDIWMIVAVIQPFRLDAVTLALEATEGFGGMTVSDCRGFGRDKIIGDMEIGRQSPSNAVDFVDKRKLEIVVASRASMDAVVDAIARIAHTGNRGDGKVFSWPVSRAVRIRTFEQGTAAV